MPGNPGTMRARDRSIAGFADRAPGTGTRIRNSRYAMLAGYSMAGYRVQYGRVWPDLQLLVREVDAELLEPSGREK